MQKLPNFSGLRLTAVVKSSVDNGSDESRGGGRGKISDRREIEGGKENGKRSRDEEKEKIWMQ